MDEKNAETEYDPKQEQQELFVLQLKMAALAKQVGVFEERQARLSTEAQLLETNKLLVSRDHEELRAIYKPRYDKLKKVLEVPEGKELNLETGDTVDAPPQQQQQ